MSPHAVNIRDTMRKEFIEENKNRDKKWSIRTTQTIPFVSETTICFNGSLGEKPWFLDGSKLCCADLFVAGWF